MWKFLLEKEFRQFLRDPMMPRIALTFPILIILVFPFAVNMEIRNINLVVVDSDRTVMSQRLIEKCTESGYFRIIDISDDPLSAMKLMDKNEADAILTIGKDFSREIVTGGGMPLGIKVNTVNGIKGSIGSQYLTNCIMLFMRSQSGRTPSPGGGATIQASPKYYYNQFLDYKLFMIPALMVIAVTMLTGFFPALNIVGEKQAGTIEQINVTPVKKSAFIICKLIPYWIIAMFMLSMCILLARVVFGYECRGSLWNVMIFSLLHIIVTAALGLIVSNYSDAPQQAMFVMMFFVLIFMMMSGVFTPIASMPKWAQVITYANPLRYYADAMRSIYLKGSGLLDVWYDAVGLLTIGTGALTWAILSYKKTS